MTAYRPGLVGVIASQTELSMIDGERGELIYRGYPITELAERASFEAAAHLLWYGDLPSAADEEAFRTELAARREIPDAARAALDALPPGAGPIDALKVAIAAEGAARPVPVPSLAGAAGIVAATPTILAQAHRRSAGLPAVAPDASLGHAANFLYMVTGERPAEAKARALSAYLVLVADHALNASTLTARVAASTGSDLHSAIVAAIAVHKGRLHGGAPAIVLEQLERALGAASLDDWYDELAQANERFIGFGHPVYRTVDPRSEILKRLTRELDPDFYERASRVEDFLRRRLAADKPGQTMPTNVEYYSPGVLQAAGLPPDLFTPAFASARMVGWAAHIVEQLAQQAAGTSRVMHPESEYVGLLDRSMSAS